MKQKINHDAVRKLDDFGIYTDCSWDSDMLRPGV